MQCQLQYSRVEDRALWLLAVDGETHGWWLTRRMSQVLFETMIACLQPQMGTTSLAQSWQLNLQHEAVQGQFNQTQAAVLTPDKPATLLTEVRYGKASAQLYLLVLCTDNEQQHTLTVSEGVLCGLLTLFSQRLSAFPWGLQLTWPPAVPAAPTGIWQH